MSLLMDALKRAEDAKRLQSAASSVSPAGGADATESASQAPSVELALEPKAATDTRTVSSLPDLQSHEAAVDKDLRETADSPAFNASEQESAHSTVTQQAVAKNVFTVKSVVSSDDQARTSAKSVVIIISVGCLVGLGVAAYYWIQLESLSARSGLVVPQEVSRAPMPRSASSVAAGAVATSVPPQVPQLPQLPVVSAVTGSESAALRETPVKSPSVAPAPSVKRSGRTQPARRVARRTDAPRAAGAERMGPVVSVTRAEPPVLKAYEALQTGDLATAKELYVGVLRADPTNTDALLGFAVIVSREGDALRAETLFSRVIELDPLNASAHSGLAVLRGSADPDETESRLKSLVAATSTDAIATATLYFSLGNLYAAQRRWGESQEAYFNAHTSDPGNPDYAYNLAVSLDRMGKKANAKEYYGVALKLAERRPGAFDRLQAETRVTELSR